MASVRIVNGPTQNQLFILRGGEVVGRDPQNAILVNAPGVSRRHFQFTAEAGQFFVLDLGSSNGTYVNNNRISKHPLIDNDTITVGGINLRFARSDTGAPISSEGAAPFVIGTAVPNMGDRATGKPIAPSRKLSFSQEEVPIGGFGVPGGAPAPGRPTASTAPLVPEVVLKDDSSEESSSGGGEDYSLDASVVFSQSNSQIPPKEQVAALQKRLKLMFEISQSLGAIKDRDELLGKIMEQLFEIFPQADRGFILVGESVDDLHPAVVRHRKAEVSKEVQISRTVARKVYNEKQAILSQNAMEDDRFSGGLSLLNFRILCMIVAPLLYRDEVYGFIHLDTQDRAKKFTADDLNLLAGLAANAAIFLKNLKLFETVAKEAEKRASLERYFSPELAKQVTSGEIDLKLGGDMRSGTVFFSDIVGFTTMSESMEAAAVVAKINRYFKDMVDLVFKYRGSIDKFMGDAIMAIWGVPVTLKDEAVYGITAGLEMQNMVFLLNCEFLQEKTSELHVGIGLNSGHFIAGNMGSERRMEFTCIGDNVNLAQRIESKAAAGNVFISESTFDRARGKVIAVKLVPTRVKGKAQPITIYSVRGVSTPSRDAPLFITSLPFREGTPDGPKALLIKAKLLGDGLVLGLCLFRELPKGEKIDMVFDVPEMPDTRVSIDLQGEVPIGASAGKCLKGVFSIAGTALETLFTDLVINSDKSPEDMPRGGSKASAEH